MSKPFCHPQAKTFQAGENRVYIADLPAHLAHSDRPRNVACKELFKLVQRNGNELIFQSGDHYAAEYRSKAYKSPSTGVEICLVAYRGIRLILEATRYLHGGRPVVNQTISHASCEEN